MSRARPAGLAGALVRGLRGVPRHPPRGSARGRAARRRLRSERAPMFAAALLTVAVIFGAGWLWLRDSSLVAVRDVFITGISSSDEAKIRRALRDAALDMTTLHVRHDRLRSAVASFTEVADVRADADFPHKLTLEVVEHRPVLVLASGSLRLPIGAGGRVMRGVRAERHVAVLRVERLPVGDRVDDNRALAAAQVLAAAPDALHERVARATFGARGLVLVLRRGPDLVFGGASQVRAKWAAAVRVLVDRSAAGAVYLDLRVPERVAAGGVAPPDPAATATPVPPVAAPAGAATPVPTPVGPAATPTPAGGAPAAPTPTATAPPATPIGP